MTLLAQTRELVPNDTLGEVLQTELERVGPPRWSDRDVALARALQRGAGVPESGLATNVVAYGPGHGSTASSDIGETSAVVPLAELNVATEPRGVSLHTWEVTSCSAHPIGFGGVNVASKVLAAAVVGLLRDPAVVRSAKQELAKATAGKPYRSPLAADAKPTPY